ncbi:hypothetical protein BG015_002851 [Linnemannia schmuckeri]|uniref:Peptidase S8/S53 domain-containing protein n=1 Tax=Linnemannia schmuckeri TaxID=64567 RepID=A0A9P5V663_9FUNG|nr:hypothetical protein BG015_002851 [Linnemannia schmuckeri]
MGGVTAYILDTGILTTHEELEGRAALGVKFVMSGPNVDDHGHVTHLAGLIGGKTYAVGKKVSLAGAKILSGTGSGITSDIIGARAIADKRGVNISLVGGKSKAINATVARLYVKNASLFATTSSSGDASIGSPSGGATTFAAGATDSNDALPAYSAYGPCVEMFASGMGIKSAWIGSYGATRTISGSPTSTALATGAVALFVSQGGLSAAQAVYNKLLAECTANVVTSQLGGANNYLLYNSGP